MLRSGVSSAGCGEQIRLLATHVNLHQQRRTLAARRLLDRTAPTASALAASSTEAAATRSIQAQATAASSAAGHTTTSSTTTNSSSSSPSGNTTNHTGSFKELYQVLKQQQDLDVLRRKVQQQGQPLRPPTIESLRDQAAALMQEATKAAATREVEPDMYGEAKEMAFFLDEIEEEFYPASRELPTSASSATSLPVRHPHLLSNGQIGAVETERERLFRLETQFEQGTIEEAVEEYREVQETLFTSGKAANLPVVKRQIFAWYGPMITAMEVLHQKLKEGKWADLGNGVGTYGPFLSLVSPEKLAVITIHETINCIIKHGNHGVPLAMILLQIAEAVRTEVNFLRLTETYGDRVLNTLRENGTISLKRVNRKAKEALEDGLWHPDLKIKVGGMLLNELHRVARVSPEFVDDVLPAEDGGVQGTCQPRRRRRRRSWRERKEQERAAAAAAAAAAEGTEPTAPPVPPPVDEDRAAFHVELEVNRSLKKRGLLFLDEATFQSMVDAEDVHHYLTPRYRPMVVEPRKWQAFDSGGYLQLKSYVVRSQNCRATFEALRKAHMPEVYDALNFLGRVKWVINHEVLDTIQEAYARGLTVGDLPSRKDLVVPPPPAAVPVHPAHEELLDSEAVYQRDRAVLRDRIQLENRIKKRNAELFSLRCDTEIKLRIAEEFREHEFYFPYNLDFRGRAYPVPPNLNHLGSDLCRGMLRFADTRPLGKEGLQWLKIHLANLCGKDKLSFEGRVAYVDSKMAEVKDSAARPLEGRGWWQKAEEPWQALAVCKEIAAALASGDPESFLSGVPVHMDGSCNGLQHYAALGRDEEGAKQVNLIHSAVPQDVYTGVCDRVVKHVHAEATKKLPRTATEEERAQQRHARLVDGMINRKVVKQTVMTSVYGVTYVGARKQIQARLKEKFQERKGAKMLTKEEEQEIYEASRYVATVTLSKLAELFSAARNIMEWLATCASLVAKQDQPMSWVTPLGLPVIQPYRRDTGLLVKTLIQSVILIDCNDKLPVSSSRQRSAFPPNFVHSLDSTHMLMTANRLKDLHIPFTAVHDSYWCHASNVEIMNASLRDCFVELYHQPILEGLRDSLVARFPDVQFPPIPARGNLRLEEVKDSPYFFD